jgi:PKD repeat protein
MITKRKLLLNILGILFVMACYTTVKAQISEGGLPPSFEYANNALKNTAGTHSLIVDFDVNQLLAEDEELEALGIPPRCAKIIPVDLDIANSGVWTKLPDGQHVWQLEITAENALALLLYYDRFIIPEGCRLFIYNSDHSKILGAYTYKTNTKEAEFATEFVGGDKIIIEYVSPSLPDGNPLIPQLKISGVAYGYNHLRGQTGEISLKSRWDSEACMINVNCPEGDNWQDQKKGVARILTPAEGGYVSLCSGTIVNNTARNYDPLFLSAHHCFEGMTTAQLNQTIYYFNYEWPGCEKLNTDPACPTLVGAQMLVDVGIQGGSDGALLRLNNPIPESYGVYFNGWDRRNIAATSGVGIHHPGGDVKKISTYTTTATSASWQSQEGIGASNAHWNIRFSATTSGFSVTQGGSSGSPMFNQNGLVVGSLTGGNSSCSYQNGQNLYGKLWYHWDQGTQKMKQYLDPINSEEEFIEGEYEDSRRVKADFLTGSNKMYVSQKINVTNTSKNAVTWDWYFEGASPATFSGEIPPAIVYNAPGVYPVTLVVNKDMETEDLKTINLTLTYKENYCDNEIQIGSGTSTAQFPLGGSQRQTFSSSIYSASELGMGNGGIIKQISWYAGSASERTRTIWVYLKEVTEESQTATTWNSEINGAVLVYQSENIWKNQTGWVNIDLDTDYDYLGTKNLKVMVRTLTTSNSDYATSNCRYSNATGKHKTWTSSSSSIPNSNGTVGAARPNIHLNMDLPCGAYQPMADFSVVGFDSDSIEIEIGDTINLIDYSTGPVVNWEWIFEGANPVSSNEKNPKVNFPNAGTFNLVLTVSNHLGSDIKAKTVVVKYKKPIVGFSSSSDGFTTAPYYGQFLPYKGGKVTFTDQSKEYPVEWLWNLEGIEPSSSDQNSFTAIYPPGENVYPVGLTVKNNAGTSEAIQEQYIRVGGTAGVWNIPYGDEGNTHYLISSGNYLTGNNSSYSILAEKFENSEFGSIDQVDLLIEVMEGSIVNRTYNIAVFSEKDGKPDKSLATVSLKGTFVNPTGYTTVLYDSLVEVNGTFFIVVSGLGTNLNKVAIGSSKESKETTYIRINNQWKRITEQYANQKPISMNIVPHFTYAPNPVGINTVDLLPVVTVYPNPVIDNLIVNSRFTMNSIFVQDIQGHRIKVFSGLDRKNMSIPVSSWARGIYIIKIQTENGSYNCKIVVNK